MSLVYDLSKVRGLFGQVFPFSLNEEYFSHSGYELVEPLTFDGTFVPDGFLISLKATASAKLKTSCGRCLKPLTFDVIAPIEEVLLFQGESEKFEDNSLEFGELGEKYWLYDKLAYDFSPLVVSYILDKLPLAPVCPSGCEVLEEKEESQLDQRWASLAQLKQDREV